MGYNELNEQILEFAEVEPHIRCYWGYMPKQSYSYVVVQSFTVFAKVF